MFIFFSKFLPLFIYPLGFASILLGIVLILKNHQKLTKILIGLAFLVLFLGGNNWVTASLVRSLEWQNLPPATVPEVDFIVVLGGGTEPAYFPRPTIEITGAGDRIYYAAHLYHLGKAPTILLSGGYIPWTGERSTPAEEMAAILMQLNVPGDAIILENDSKNTYENAVNTQKILLEENANNILLVTSAMHMPRSIALFRKQGIDAIPAPTDFMITERGWESLWELNFGSQIFNIVPTAGNLSKTTSALKEYIGIMVYFFRGWI